MFTDNSIRSIEVDEGAVFVRALVEKLAGVDKNRIHASDDLVLRKAIFGLIEVVGVLEQRIAAGETPAVREGWADTLRSELESASPDQIRLGE